ncbi:ATP synthase subunit b, mitochondrial-like [Danaus plexippus]|uniref:ATP synthase subunit b, mitochondrial-like n=1 Tax=Danaus plexippus TaxID=13037 RepID=UPI002AB08546|nr:ATP synthase subunit b, mitochondrial-like [Danaus plexippus]
MILNCITKLGYRNSSITPTFIFKHTETCPVNYMKKKTTDRSLDSEKDTIKRALKSGPVRLAIFPEEWFLFFHNKTGVTGPYIFGICLTNYLVSKEIFIMEHEYYIGLSIFVVLYFATTNFGNIFAEYLDKQVDAYVNDIENERKAEKNVFDQQIKQAEDAIWRAQGQKVLMDAKKENILMQLEAVYRERLMHAYRSIKGRMDYQVKLHQSNARIQQKWMIEWIIDQVKKSITPDFEKRVFDNAILQIADAAGRVK